jgi:hypothetical protein
MCWTLAAWAPIRAASSRVTRQGPPMTVRSSRRARTGWTKPKLAQAPFEGIELDLVDPTRVRRIWAELIDRVVGNSNW